MSNQAANVMQSNEPAAGMGASQRFFGAFTDPVKTFAEIVRKPDFWTPLIAMIVASVAASELFLNRVSMAEVVRHQIELNGRARNMSAGQLQQAVQIGAKIGTWSVHIWGLIGIPVVVFVIALIGMAIMKLVFGGPPRFSTAWSISTYALLPTILAAILLIIVVLFGDPANMTTQNLAPTNVGFFLSPQSVSRPLYVIARSIDFFTFWVMGLLGIGFAASSEGKARPRSVFFSFLVLWVIWVLIKAGMAMI